MRLFVLLSRFPYPLEKGDKLRAFHQLRILSKHHEIILCALHEEPIQSEWLNELRPYCTDIHSIKLDSLQQLIQLGGSVFNAEPFQVGYFFQPQAKKKIEALVKQHRPHVIYCQLLRTAKYVWDVKNIPRVMDLQDAFSKGIERRLQTDPWYLQPILRAEQKRLERYETEVFHEFDHCTIISEQDRNHLPFSGKERVTVVRNGVETGMFRPSFEEKDTDVLFAGNMGYPPNVEGAIFLATEVMPKVREQLPGTRLMLAGARPTKKVLELADHLTEVTGWVEDIRACYARSRVFVAPMNIGTGLQNKLLEAMSMQLPCVTSDLANNALQAVPDEEILIASSAEEYAAHIVELLRNEQKAAHLANAGHLLINDQFGWEAMTAPLLQVLQTAVQTERK